MKAVAVIPARMGSTRFEGKVLARETGKYLIQHVYERVRQSRRIEGVYVATDDARVGAACEEFGCEWFMTRADHLSGTDRIAEVAQKLDCDVIVNVQGDEPEIQPGHVDRVVEVLEENEGADMGTLAARFEVDEKVEDPAAVKVVMDRWGRALYFSRSVIPFQREAADEKPVYYKHLGIYSYRKAVLLRLSGMEPTPLERSEKLEQLRAMENGLVIMAGVVDHPDKGIDTPEDYEAFLKRYRKRW